MESVYIEKASQLEAEEIKRILKNILWRRIWWYQ
jgi:hypothetical protein